MKNFVALSIFCSLVVFSFADIVPVKDCGSKLGTMGTVDISSCPKIPCDFKKGTNISVQIDFTSKSAVSAATTKVYGVIAGVKVPFPLPDPDACHDMACPLSAGQKVTYKNKVFVEKSYPEITLIVLWEIISSDQDVICFSVPVKITS